jgi:S1-C subfamily serine protease
MGGLGRVWAVAGVLLVAGCSSEVYGVFGEENEVFTGQMTGGADGRIELDNGKGTRCIGDYTAGRSTVGTAVGVAAILIGGSAAAGVARPSSRPGAGRSLLSCNDGQQALIQFTSLGSNSGYGFGTTDRGRPVRFTYGLSREQGAKYLGTTPGQAAAPGTTAAPGQPQTRSTGTGFFISHQGHVLTNAHVVEGCKDVSVAPVGGAPMTATVVSADKQNDLAVLSAPTPPTTIAMLRGGHAVRQGEPVVAYGFPYAGSLSSGGALTTGSINALSGLKDDTRFFQISAPVQPGNSGGPLFDSTGAVVGVVTSGLRGTRTSSPQNVNFAVKADVVRTFLGAVGVSAETAPAGRELSTPDIGERARAFSVLVECKG